MQSCVHRCLKKFNTSPSSCISIQLISDVYISSLESKCHLLGFSCDRKPTTKNMNTNHAMTCCGPMACGNIFKKAVPFTESIAIFPHGTLGASFRDLVSSFASSALMDCLTNSIQSTQWWHIGRPILANFCVSNEVKRPECFLRSPQRIKMTKTYLHRLL